MSQYGIIRSNMENNKKTFRIETRLHIYFGALPELFMEEDDNYIVIKSTFG
jgi:hypothetical protein